MERRRGRGTGARDDSTSVFDHGVAQGDPAGTAVAWARDSREAGAAGDRGDCAQRAGLLAPPAGAAGGRAARGLTSLPEGGAAECPGDWSRGVLRPRLRGCGGAGGPRAAGEGALYRPERVQLSVHSQQRPHGVRAASEEPDKGKRGGNAQILLLNLAFQRPIPNAHAHDSPVVMVRVCFTQDREWNSI